MNSGVSLALWNQAVARCKAAENSLSLRHSTASSCNGQTTPGVI